MTATLSNKNIALPRVDFSDFTYSITPASENGIDQSLIKSVGRYGILHPPVVKETAPEIYCIIAGRKRLQALRAQPGNKECSCLVVSPGIQEITVFEILLDEIQLRRQLTSVEKAIFLQKISPLTDEQMIVKEFMPRLDLAPDSQVLQEMLRLLTMEDHILLGLHRDVVHETVARDFVTLSARDRSVLFEVITALKPSYSNQKKLVHICRELAGREDKSIAALLDNPEVDAIVSHQEANPPQKTKNLMAWLSRRHKPRVMQAEEEFHRFVTALNLPRNASIKHTPSFEDESLTLSITFQNRKSLENVWEKIKHAATDRNQN